MSMPGSLAAPAARAAASLATLFAPASVAVVGASSDPTKLSGRPLRYLRSYGYAGRIYPVNPRYAEVDSLTCHPSVTTLPEPPELALILSPAESVPALLRECGERGTNFAVVIASGFAEAGNTAGQAAIREVAETTGMRVVGPNCVGLLSTASKVTATFSTVLQRGMVPAGPISIVSQSGALANSLLQSLWALSLGVGHWISLGNEADLSAIEVLEFLAGDPQTRVIVLFVEGFRQGQRLVAAGRRARAAGKTVLLLRGGQSEAGRQASLSHTGKLASAAGVGRALARQAGIVQVDTMSDLLDALQAAGLAGAAPVRGLGVLTVSGGQGVLLSDAAARAGVPLAELAPETRRRLADILPPTVAGSNPVDVALLGSNERYFACARTVLADPGVSHLLWVLSSLANHYEELPAPLLEVAAEARGTGKALIVSYLSPHDRLPAEAEAALRAAGAPVLWFAEQAVETFGRLAPEVVDAPQSGQLVPPRTPGQAPSWAQLERLLRGAGIPLPRSSLVPTPEAAAAAAAEIDGPVALKAVAPTLAHKTEAGAVRLGLASPAEVRRAAEQMLEGLPAEARTGLEGLLVQEMVRGGVEVILGATWDPEFGPVLSIGAGGVLAELLRDTAFVGLPATAEDVLRALESTRIAHLLAGFRGTPPADRDALVDCAVALAGLYAREPWLQELELNPVAVLPRGRGVAALDALAIPAPMSA